jgi:hypothetical protein
VVSELRKASFDFL